MSALLSIPASVSFMICQFDAFRERGVHIERDPSWFHSNWNQFCSCGTHGIIYAEGDYVRGWKYAKGTAEISSYSVVQQRTWKSKVRRDLEITWLHLSDSWTELERKSIFRVFYSSWRWEFRFVCFRCTEVRTAHQQRDGPRGPRGDACVRRGGSRYIQGKVVILRCSIWRP
jgi:hypothetical protein